MASLKGSTELWLAETVSDGDASTWGYIGTGISVAFYITSDANATFKVQASYGTTGVSAGLNEIDADDPDGGIGWFDYIGFTGITVTAGEGVCADLSPFGPPYVRLVAVTATDAVVSASVSSVGPN